MTVATVAHAVQLSVQNLRRAAVNYKDGETLVSVKLLETLEKIVGEHLTCSYIRGVQPNYKDYQAKQELSKLLVDYGRNLLKRG